MNRSELFGFRISNAILHIDKTSNVFKRFTNFLLGKIIESFKLQKVSLMKKLFKKFELNLSANERTVYVASVDKCYLVFRTKVSFFSLYHWWLLTWSLLDFSECFPIIFFNKRQSHLVLSIQSCSYDSRRYFCEDHSDIWSWKFNSLKKSSLFILIFALKPAKIYKSFATNWQFLQIS